MGKRCEAFQLKSREGTSRKMKGMESFEALGQKNLIDVEISAETLDGRKVLRLFEHDRNYRISCFVPHLVELKIFSICNVFRYPDSLSSF
jgi:hypothetical protein